MPCNPERFRKRAKELRALAEKEGNGCKEVLLQLAAEYEELAEKHENKTPRG